MALAITACPQCGLEYSDGEVFCPVDGARLTPRRAPEGSPRPSAEDPLIGATLAGRYRILRKIGEGGMGIVYEAEHVLIEKRVGLKVLREDFSSRFDVVERFRQEARSASKIGHEHIIDISDFGVTQAGANFFVMELLQGHDLATELEKRGPLSPRRTLHIALQCAEALGAAHQKGIVHRDMKPENIFLVEKKSDEDFVKIVDFGIAKINDLDTPGQPGRKLTKTGMIFGTPEYMSPEQAAGKPLDHRVDIYALGVILYELLVGRVPFMGDTFMGILTQHMFEPVPPLTTFNPRCSVPAEVERIVFRALAKDPDERYRSMEELAHDLSGALTRTPNTLSSLAPPPGTVTHYGTAELDEPGVPRAPRLMAAAPASERPGGGKGWLWIAVVGASALGASSAGVLLFTRHDDAAQVATEPRAGDSLPKRGGEREAAVLAPPVPAIPEPPPKVLIQVNTQPAGADVVVDDAPACSPTPCTLSAERGSLLKIRAEMAGYRASNTVLRADDEHANVQLVLKRRSQGPARPRPAEGELLIPDAFARPRAR